MIRWDDHDYDELIGYDTEMSMTQLNDDAFVDEQRAIRRINELKKESGLDEQQIRASIDNTVDYDVRMRLNGWVNCLFIRNPENDETMLIPAMKQKDKESKKLTKFFLV